MEQTTGKSGIGSRIKRTRRAQGLTALELARRVGITENAIRKIESGASKEPRLSTALQIASVLQVEADFLTSRIKHQRRSGAPELATVIRKIRDFQPALSRRGVKHLRIFGSVARGDAQAQSDIDVIIQPTTAQFTLIDLAGTKDVLSNALGREVDVVTEETIRRSAFYKNADEEAILVF